MDARERINGLTLQEFEDRINEIVSDRYCVNAVDILGDFMSYDNWSEGITPEDYYEEELRFEIEEAVEVMNLVAKECFG